MQIGLVGLGKMGGNMRERIRAAGHTVVGYDTNPTAPTSATCPTSSTGSTCRASSG
ncbi:NAD(P)-binding domain-containing protein [Streptomyces sp. INA 01156]